MDHFRSICNLSSVSLVSILLMKLNQTPRVLQLECKKVCADCMLKAMKSKVSSKSLIFQTVSPNFVYKVTETYSTIFFQFYLLLFSHFSRKVVITFPLLTWKGMKSSDCIYLVKHGIYLQQFHSENDTGCLIWNVAISNGCSRKMVHIWPYIGIAKTYFRSGRFFFNFLKSVKIFHLFVYNLSKNFGH